MTIRVGITFPHGIALEHISHPPDGVEYRMLKRKNSHLNNMITPAIMWSKYEDGEVDIVEAPIFPVITKKPLLFTPADAYTLFGFNLLGVPVPKAFRALIVFVLLKRLKFYRIVFKSKAGRESLSGFPQSLVKKIVVNSLVVYPAVKGPELPVIASNKEVLELLFAGGDFFRKGGANVVDAFLALWRQSKNIRLRIYTRPSLDDAPARLSSEYLAKIRNCPGIELYPLIPRQEFLNTALSRCDIFLMPTYQESYGFAIQEATAYGKPVISTDIFAIPEIVTHNKSGFLIPVRTHPFIKNFRGYYIRRIPEDFKEFVSHSLYNYMKMLVENNELRMQLGTYGWKHARIKFSFEERNRKMLEIYNEALGVI